MCPTYPHSRAPIDAQIVVSPYFTWLRNACCVSLLFFQHRESDPIEKAKCPECYTSASENKKRNYQGVLWHYIHLGLPERFEFCSAYTILTHSACRRKLSRLSRSIRKIRRLSRENGRAIVE